MEADNYNQLEDIWLMELPNVARGHVTVVEI